MSAAEIIEQIKALPLEEQMKVLAYICEVERQSDPTNDQCVRYADDKTFEEVAERIFERHDELFKKLAE